VWGLATSKPAPAIARSESDDVTAQIAQLYRDGKYAEALPLALRLAEASKQKLGEGSTRYATALSWLAKVYVRLGKAADAEPLTKRALAIREDKLGAEHLDTAHRGTSSWLKF
jgi:Tetratricopeptide repeat